jgi:hypothetical protein
MDALDAFKMPNPMKITGRTSTITNAFVNAIISQVFPSKEEVSKALKILQLDPDDLRCAYCGTPFTEWDHLRPLVRNKKPTGYVSEIANLVPSCGKCNQSKGSKEWRVWITSKAKLSPASKGISDLQHRIARLEEYEQWRRPIQIDFSTIVPSSLWNEHWNNHEKLLSVMKECQRTADRVREVIEQHVKSRSTASKAEQTGRL